ncbi:MAG: 6-carboxytetrahydropterin synthase QueD [Deltaproteobacteria bacterium]|nr:6-carboxytetrahydropterin synthase QueD [Deltaproteobacteria bacterium]
MYELKIITQFAAAHRLENFYGKCESLHGHNWKVEVFLAGEQLDEAGLLVDFGVIKARTNALLEEIDHKYLNELEAFREQNPSSENLARYLFERLSADPIRDGVRVSRVNVWESDTSRASYYRD